MNYKYNLQHILAAFVVIRTLQCLAIYYVPFQFDTSSTILIQEYVKSASRYNKHVLTILNNLLSWDSVYFMKLAMSGISYEHEWMFGPLLWRLVYTIREICDFEFYDVLLTYIVINNLLILWITKLIYSLSLQVYDKNLKWMKKGGVADREKFAYVCSMLILIQPSGIFSSVAYSETPVQFLSYLGLYYYFKSRSPTKILNKSEYFASGFLFSLSFGIRTNSILFGILYIYDLFKFWNVVDIMVILVTGLQLFGSLLYSIYLPYSMYCPARGEWCNSMTKSLVFYAQSHYWDNGFLKYFKMSNVPMFLIAAPQLVIICKSILQFWELENLKSLMVMSVVYLFLQFTCMHVQIINRVSSFIPIHILYASLLFVKGSRWGTCIVRWWIIWLFLQTALFAAFLPPAWGEREDRAYSWREA